ncbi:MAG: hypothetical protein H7Y09_08875 [Chitinophagaceae bacterium]|nr:hypothetical protein [Anaerolineae bacterium]
MQISRHWRMNSQRYRLMGIRYENGEVSIQNRPISSELPKSQQSEKLSDISTQREVVHAG